MNGREPRKRRATHQERGAQLAADLSEEPVRAGIEHKLYVNESGASIQVQPSDFYIACRDMTSRFLYQDELKKRRNLYGPGLVTTHNRDEHPLSHAVCIMT